MKVLKVLGVLLAVLVLAAGGAYYALLVPPDSAAVCENVVKVVLEDPDLKAKFATLPDELRSKALEVGKKETGESCLKATEKGELEGIAPWVKRLKCMRDVTDMAGLKACDD